MRMHRQRHVTVLLTVLVGPGTAFQALPKSSLFRGPTMRSKDPEVNSHLAVQQNRNSEDHHLSIKDKKTTPKSFQDQTRNVIATGVLLGLTTFFSLPLTTSAADDAMLQQETTSAMATQSQTTANVRAGLSARRYWNIMASQEENAEALRIQANEGLLDYAVGTVNTMYYDNTGGVRFNQRDFYNRWKALRDETRQTEQSYHSDARAPTLATRKGAVDNLKWLISTLNDPYSKYLTREELWQELNTRNDGFLGIGALVETPEQGEQFFARGSSPTLATVLPDDNNNNQQQRHNPHKKDPVVFHNAARVQNLPVVTAVVPDSPAERAGITVGDRIVAVGEYSFLGQSREDVSRNFQARFAAAANYFGHSDVTFAKPVFRTLLAANTGNGDEDPVRMDAEAASMKASQQQQDREVVIGYRQTRVRLPTKSIEEDHFSSTPKADPSSSSSYASTNYVVNNENMESDISPPPTRGGNAIVHWELISSAQSSSIFPRSSNLMANDNTDDGIGADRKVGYIRLTRFSRAATAGYIEAVQALEDLGATSFIIDVRNNYGGIIQEAMLTASSLLRDPHAVLCYTMNARGGFTPHDVEEYVVDKRYPGYMLSREPRWVTLNQAQRENPDMFDDNGSRWVPPSSYASLKEQTAKRGLHRPPSSYSYADDMESTSSSWLQWNTASANAYNNHNQQWMAQRNLVILINEGTASAAEVFASSLHDNGRTLAVIGTKSYGKGLIQHTFPMPDGGGLRLTVAEYLTPALRHVTVVGNAKFDRVTGEQVGGGIKPDLHCESKQGIPSNIGADLCVGMALDVLEEAEPTSYSSSGQEKHHRQQKLKQRQQQDDWTKKGILAQGSPDTSGGTQVLTTVSSSSVVAQEQTVAENHDERLDDYF